MKARLAVVVLAVAGVTACGTTVPLEQQVPALAQGDLSAPQQQPGAQALDPGTAVVDPATGEALPGARSAPGRAPGGAGVTDEGGAGGSTAVGIRPATREAVSRATAPGRAAPRRAVAPGGRLVIGFPTSKSGAAAASSLGVEGVSTGDQENQMRAVAAALNARGGVLGRRVVLAPHDTPSVERSRNPDAADAAACAAWKDAKAFVVVNVIASRILRACLGRAGIPIISSLSISSAASLYGDTLPGVYAPSAMSVDRYVRAVVDRLVARGFFTGWDPATGRPGPVPVKIGMQSFEDADGKHVVDVTRAALVRHGLRLDEVEAHSRNLDDTSSSTSGAVLRFRASGITHVIDANLLFFQTSASQDYRPRHVIQDTINTPALLAQNVPPSQLRGSMGAGYLPLYEVENPPDTSEEAARCKALMRAAGEDTRPALALAFMLHACDAVFFLDRALTAAGEVSTAGLRNGAVKVGISSSHLTYGSEVLQARRDGATRVKDFAYVEDCRCFRHSSSTTYLAR